MSEFERSRSAITSFVPPPRAEAFLEEHEIESSSPGERPIQREGLPPGFRMRHDAHYVEQLTTRTAAPHIRLLPIRDIDGPRPPEARELGPLVRSIAAHGVLQPLLVRPRGGRFEVIAGVKRLAAAALAGLSDVPCLVQQADDARALALAEAGNVQVGPGARLDPAPAAPASPDVPVSGLAEITRSFGAIESCLLLLDDRDTALRDRVALDLIRTEVQRAGRLARALDVLARDPVLSSGPVALPRVLDQVIDAFAPECRLSGADLAVTRGEAPRAVRADPEWLAVALSAALGGLLAMVQAARRPVLEITVSASAAGSSAVLAFAQDAVTVPAGAFERFFDASWTDRPGGYQTAVELAAARKLIELHRGSSDVMPGDRGGCRLLLLLPTA